MPHIKVEYQTQARRQQILEFLKKTNSPITTSEIRAALYFSPGNTLINDLNELSLRGQIMRIKKDGSSSYYWSIK